MAEYRSGNRLEFGRGNRMSWATSIDRDNLPRQNYTTTFLKTCQIRARHRWWVKDAPMGCWFCAWKHPIDLLLMKKMSQNWHHWRHRLRSKWFDSLLVGLANTLLKNWKIKIKMLSKIDNTIYLSTIWSRFHCPVVLRQYALHCRIAPRRNVS